jgi:hypothetical protein
MDLEADALVPFDRELVFRTYRDELPEIVEFMPSVRRIEVKSREDQGNVTRLVNVWRGGGEIPAAARVVLSESMLSWTDHALWDSLTQTCRWRIETHSFRDAVRCEGSTRFVATDGTTRIEIRGELVIDATRIRGVPKFLTKGVGNTVTEFLVRKIGPNLLEASEGVRRYLERKKSKQP